MRSRRGECCALRYFQVGSPFRLARRVAPRGSRGGQIHGTRQFCWRVLEEGGLARSANEDSSATPPSGLPNALGLPAGTLPVFLRLRNLTPHHLGQGLRAFITDSLASSNLPSDLASPGPDLLACRGVLWVFDGLDEVVNEKACVHVCGWIKQALEDRPGDFFLVTSRYQGVQGRVDLGPAFCRFHVKPLNETQVAEFVSHWYHCVLQKLHGQDADIAEKAGQEMGSLMGMLRQPKYRIGRLRELPASALSCTSRSRNICPACMPRARAWRRNWSSTSARLSPSRPASSTWDQTSEMKSQSIAYASRSRSSCPNTR